MAVQFTRKGGVRRIEPRAGESLLEALRERCDTISPKDGCAPQGQCGCCLALVDGQPKVACLVGAGKVAGKSVLTLAGVDPEERGMVARWFVAAACLSG